MISNKINYIKVIPILIWSSVETICFCTQSTNYGCSLFFTICSFQSLVHFYCGIQIKLFSCPSFEFFWYVFQGKTIFLVTIACARRLFCAFGTGTVNLQWAIQRVYRENFVLKLPQVLHFFQPSYNSFWSSEIYHSVRSDFFLGTNLLLLVTQKTVGQEL